MQKPFESISSAISFLLYNIYIYIYICYSPAGRSVLGKTVPSVLSTARGVVEDIQFRISRRK